MLAKLRPSSCLYLITNAMWIFLSKDIFKRRWIFSELELCSKIIPTVVLRLYFDRFCPWECDWTIVSRLHLKSKADINKWARMIQLWWCVFCYIRPGRDWEIFILSLKWKDTCKCNRDKGLVFCLHTWALFCCFICSEHLNMASRAKYLSWGLHCSSSWIIHSAPSWARPYILDFSIFLLNKNLSIFLVSVVPNQFISGCIEIIWVLLILSEFIFQQYTIEKGCRLS